MLIAELAEGSETVVPAAPGTAYTFTLESADGSPVTGTTTASAVSGEAVWYHDNNLNSPNNRIGLWDAPDKPLAEWTQQDLGAGNLRPHVGDKLAVSVQSGSRPASSDETVSVLYVVYDSRGAIVSEDRDSLIWNEMWADRTWYSLVPSIPDVPGSYRLEIYINSRRLARINFSVRN